MKGITISHSMRSPEPTTESAGDSLDPHVSDLAADLEIGVPKLHEWIQREVIEAGHGSLDEGHWPTATEANGARRSNISVPDAF